MKKYLLSILFLLMFTAPVKAQAPWDLIYHAMPISVGFDIPEEITQISGQVQTAVSQAKKIIMTFKTDISNVQSAIMSTFNKIKSGAILDIFGNPGQAQASFCGKDVNKTKAKVIAKKVKEVLLIAQSDDFSYITEHNKQRERFFMDNVYAIHAASLILQQEVETDIKAQIDKAKSCAEGKGGECGIPATDEGGNNETIFTYGKTLEAMDSVVRLWESVAALKARLAAVKMIKTITPALDAKAVNKKGRKTSFVFPDRVIKSHSSTPIAFAQLSISSISQNLKNNSIEKVESAAIVKKESEAMQYIANTIDFVSPDMDEEENALASVQNEMESLGEMNEVETLVSSAIDAHNFLKELPQHKESAEQFIEMQQKYKESFQRLVASEECAIRYLSKYYTKPHLVWSGNLPLKNANKHDLRKGISGWAFNAFELLKSGEATDAFNAFTVAKEQQNSEEAKQENDDYLTDEDALNEKVENTMSTSNTKPDEIAQETLSNEEVSSMSDEPDQYLDMDGKRFNEGAGEKTEGEAISADKKKNAGSEARKSAMLHWQIGSEASKLLGDPAQKWGSPSTGVKLVWTDTKRFYKKYLEMKYDNILRYMKSYSEADLLELIAKKMVGDSQKASDSSYQKDRKAKMAELAEASKNSLMEKLGLRKKERSVADSSIKAIEDKKLAIEAKMDALNQELRSTRDEINNTKTNEANKALKAVELALTAPVEFPKGNEVPSNKKVGKLDVTEMTANVNTTSTQGMESNKDIKKKEERVKEIQKELAQLVAQQMKMTVEINKTKLAAQQAAVPDADLEETTSSVEEALMAALSGSGENQGVLAALQQTSKANALGTIRKVLLDSNAKNPIEGFNIETAMAGIKQGATNVVLEAQAIADKIIVEEGLAKLYALGDDLYSEASYPKVEKIHNDMINKLKAVNLAFTAVGQTIAPVLSVKNLLVFSEFLEGKDTSPELVDFFVGSTPKERDLKAPFKLRGFDLPPVREVFHFDAVDFTNVQPSQQEEKAEGGGDWLEKLFEKMANAKTGKKRRAITKEDFLNYGGYIPPIWEYMLKDYPFVESRLPLNEVLQTKRIEKVGGVEKEVEDDTCETVSFARGGVMPCLYGNGKYVMDINKKSNYINDNAEDKHKNLSPCASITNNKGKAYHSFWKINLADAVINKDDAPPSNCEYSELGMLLEADKHNNLFIRKNPFQNFNRINKREGEDINKMGALKKRNLAAAKHSELSRNQIGDFLKQAENEKKSKENLDEASAEYEKSKEAVYALFAEFGFVPSKDFSLADKDDYKQAVKILKGVKKQRLQKASAALGKVEADEEARLAKDEAEYKKEKAKIEANEKDKKKARKKIRNLKKPEENKPLKEKSRNMKKLINFMNTDVESILKLSMADADSNDLAIRLVKETANVKILDKFKKRNDKEKEEFSDVEEAYCAIY